MRRAPIFLFAGLLVFASLLRVGANAQVAGGNISGTVTNASQVALPNAQITLKNVATGVARVVTTDASGFYLFPNLAPGTYEISVEAPAFTTQVRTNIAVTVAAKLTVNIVMQAGDQKQVIRAEVSTAPESQASSTVHLSGILSRTDGTPAHSKSGRAR